MASSWSTASYCWHLGAGGRDPAPPARQGEDSGRGLRGSWEPPLSPILARLSPKTLSCKGKDVENVFTIRTPEDAKDRKSVV